MFLRILLLVGFLQLSFTTHAADAGWFAKPYVGASLLSATDGSRVDQITQDLDVETDAGFLAGMGVGYRYNDNWATEIAWEYRTNDSETIFADGTRFGDGNYASNTFYLNGYYFFDAIGHWQPYVGAGLGWTQEIDLDLEGLGPEQSFSGDGDVALQIYGGAEYQFTDRLYLNLELRYSRLSSVDLDAESNALGAIEGLDYTPLTFGAGLTYRF